MSTEDWNNLNGNHEDLKPLSDPRPVLAPILNPTTISQSNIQSATQPVVEETASVSETKKGKKEKKEKLRSEKAPGGGCLCRGLRRYPRNGRHDAVFPELGEPGTL